MCYATKILPDFLWIGCSKACPSGSLDWSGIPAAGAGTTMTSWQKEHSPETVEPIRSLAINSGFSDAERLRRLREGC